MTPNADYAPVVQECIANGTHLTDCDDQGYCNFCGHQDNPDLDAEEAQIDRSVAPNATVPLERTNPPPVET